MSQVNPIARSILEGLGWTDPMLDTVAVRDNGKILPTPLAIEQIAAGVIAAVGLAVSQLWFERTGRRQTGSVTTRAAGLALDAPTYLRVDGRDIKDKDRLTGFYRTRDGWAYLHGNFPHLRDGLLAMMGASNKDELAKSVALRDAMAIEAEAARRGLCAVALRNRAEWQRSEQAAATACLPLVEIERIGNAPPQPMTQGERPLSGVRVLDLSRVIAGPMIGKTLAEHGADVLLISGPGLPSIEQLVIETGFGKRSGFIELRDESGRASLSAMVGKADVFIDAYRPTALAAKGFGAQELSAMHPGIITVSVSAFGRTGPWRDRRGYDSLVQAAVGLNEMNADGEPKRLPCQPLDYLTGYLGATGAMAALSRRSREGGSWHVRLSLERTAAWLFEMADRLGRIADPPAARASAEEVADMLMQTTSPFGQVQHARPALSLDETPGFWSRPPVPLGSDPANWL